MKLWRSERGMIIALVVIGATIAVALGRISPPEYVAILTACIQFTLAYKAMPSERTQTPSK